MIWYIIAFQLLFFAAHIGWERARMVYIYTVPGSLEREAAAHRRRVWRWPGAMAYPFWVVTQFWINGPLMFKYTWTAPFVIILVMAMTLIAIIDIRRLLAELKEDDDDWFNKGKKKAKRIRRQVAAAVKPWVVAPVRT